MDASYKIQRGIHVHLIQFFMCPEFWVHITPSSRICTIKSVACQTTPHFFFSINKTRSTQLNFRLCAPGFIAWIGVHKDVQKFMSVFAIKGYIPFVRGLFLFSR